MSRKPPRDDEALGMNEPMDRRDFLKGVAETIGALGVGLGANAKAAEAIGWQQDQPGYYPPLLNGMRGSHPGSFENAHRLRDGEFWSSATSLKETGEEYDLIVVGGGIS